MLQLGDTGVEADASFAGRMEQWLATRTAQPGSRQVERMTDVPQETAERLALRARRSM